MTLEILTVQDISLETQEVMSIIPSQLRPLRNQFDYDGDSLYFMSLTEDENFEQIQRTENIELVEEVESMPIQSQPTTALPNTSSDIGTVSTINYVTTKTLKKVQTPRSTLVDMEHEEHQLRMKTLAVEYEVALTKKQINIGIKEFEEERSKLQLEILRKRLEQFNT